MASQRPYNKALGALRLLAMWAFVVIMVGLARPTPLGVAIGALFAALGEVVRFWSAGHLYKNVELVTSGPYRYTRNPLYLGRLLILTGLCTMASLPFHANWIALGLGCLVFFGYYLPRKERVEPARLREVHGEAFERYFKAVPALFPTLQPYAGASGARWSSERMLRNGEHWWVVGLVLLTLVLLWRSFMPAVV